MANVNLNYPPFEGDAVRVEALVENKAIANLCRLIALYEGICFVRTKDPRTGLVEFWVSPSFVSDFKEIITAIRDEENIPMTLLEEGS